MTEENRVAPKFKVIFNSNDTPSDKRLEELKKWCRIFHEKDLAPPYCGGSYGNLSFRKEPRKTPFIITGTNIGLKDNLSDDKFAEVTGIDIENMTVYATGKISPSSESLLHFAIYEARHEINAVFHGHSNELLERYKDLNIASTEKEEDYGSKDLVRRVLNILGDNNIIIMKGHGFISLGKTMEEAGNTISEVIKSAGQKK